jgi:hypothetical protein
MRGGRAPFLVLLAILGLGAADMARHVPRLPGRVAIHFDFAGHANGWARPVDLVRIHGIVLLCLLLVTGAAALMTRHLPPSLINVPNKRYWFAPERSESSRQRLGAHMVWMMVISAGLIVALQHLVFLANLGTAAPRLPSTGLMVLLVAFLTALGAWTAGLLRLFRRPR